MKINRYDAKTLAILAMFFCVLIGGAVPVATKFALRDIPPFSFTFLRFVIAGATILPFLVKNRFTIRKNLYKAVLFSLFMTINVIFFPLGVHLTTATVASTLYVFGPIVIAILSYFFLAEKFTSRKIVGIVAGFAGALVIILLPEINKYSPFAGNTFGNLLIGVAVIATAMYTVLSKEFQKSYTPFQLTAIFIFTSCLVLFPLAGIDVVMHPHWWGHVTESALIALLYCGFLGTTLWYLLYQYAIKHASPLIASMVLYLQPAATFFWAFSLLGEQLTGGLLFGATLTFIGVFLTLKSKKQPLA